MAKKPLYPHVPKSRKSPPAAKPTRENVSVESWMERDRLGIWITDNRTGKTIAEWWDDNAREMFTDGFFKPAAFTRGEGLSGPEFIDSVLDYAEETGILAESGRMQPSTVRKFSLGQLVMTRGVNNMVADNTEFAKFVTESLQRHARGDWGELSEEDKKENEYSVDKRLRLFSAYENPPLPKIWIITEADRSVTTILLPEEY